MSPQADSALLSALAALQSALQQMGAPSMIIGGIAVIARGVARQTQDIDATVWAADLAIDDVLAAMASCEILPRIPDAKAFATRHQVLLLRHEPTGTPMELSLAWLPFEREAMERASQEQFDRVAIKVAQPDDLVVFKAVAWRDRDRSDIERLLVLHGESIDLDRVRRIVADFAAALDDDERPAALEAIIDRALGR